MNANRTAAALVFFAGCCVDFRTCLGQIPIQAGATQHLDEANDLTADPRGSAVPNAPSSAATKSGSDVRSLASQPARKGTELSELIFIAQTSNPALCEASAKVAVAQGNAIQVGLPPNPMVFTSSPQWSGKVSQYNVVFGQDFITAGKLGLNRAVAQRTVEQAQLEFSGARYAVITDVRRQFYATAVAQRRRDVLNELVRTLKRSDEVGRNHLAAGLSNIADSMLLTIDYEKARLGYESQLAVLKASRARLAAAIGDSGMAIEELAFDLEAPLPDFAYEAVRAGVIDRNTAAAVAAVEVRKTDSQLRRAEAEPYPNFNVQAGYQYGTRAPLHQQGYAQFTSSLPIWDRNQGGIRAARADTARAAAAVERVENELSQQTATALGEYRTASERTSAYAERILPKAEEVHRSNVVLYEKGQTGVLLLLQSQRTLIDADLGYLDAQLSRWNSAITLAGLLRLELFP